MVNIIASNGIAYQNECLLPQVRFLVGDIAKMENNHTGYMLEAAKGEFYYYKEGEIVRNADHHHGVCGCYGLQVMPDTESIVHAVHHAEFEAYQSDCHVYAIKSDKYGMVVEVVGLDDDGRHYTLGKTAWDKVLRAKNECAFDDKKYEMFVDTAEEAAELVARNMGTMLNLARQFADNDARETAERREKVAEMKKKILEKQGNPKKVEDRLFDPDAWWEGLTDTEKAAMAHI